MINELNYQTRLRLLDALNIIHSVIKQEEREGAELILTMPELNAAARARLALAGALNDDRQHIDG